MDPLFERLRTLFRASLGGGFEADLRSHRWADPDLRSAMEELDGFLNGRTDDLRFEREDDFKAGPSAERESGPAMSEELKKDFATLNIPPSAQFGEVKKAYRELLRTYHPDRFAADAEKFKTASEITSRLNQAYQRIEAWFDRA